jgi:hypothetical protein
VIANIIGMAPTFHGAVSYNLRGHDGTKHDKCAWWALRNVPGDDPDLGATIMEATARLSTRVKTPAFHFSIDWHKDERPTEEMSKKAAEAVLRRLGLADHQSIVFSHQDAAHPHVHLVVNRVHPESGKAWAHWKSKERLERAARETALELGFWAIEGRHEVERGETSRKSRSAYRREERLNTLTEGEAKWTSHARIERVFAARYALHAHEFVRAARAYRFQRRRTRSAELRRDALRSRHADLLAKRRGALWSGLGAVLTGRSAKKKDNEARRLQRRIASIEKQLAVAHSRLTAEQERLAAKESHLNTARSQAGSRTERKAKREELRGALRSVAPSDLRLIKLPRRERQQLMAMVKSAKENEMAHPESSALLMLSIARKEKYLLGSIELEFVRQQSLVDSAKEDIAKFSRDLANMKDGSKNAIRLKEKLAEKKEELAFREKTFGDIAQLKRDLAKEINDLRVKLRDAKDRERER